MGERQSGSYGLRRVAAPKKFDSDFEYYYIKSKSEGSSHAQVIIKEEPGLKARDKYNVDSNESTEEPSQSPKRRYEVQFVEVEQSPENNSKRARGRPRKFQAPDETVIIPDEADMDVDYVHLKSKREKRQIKEDQVEVSTVEAVIESLEQGMGEDLMVEEVIPQGETHVIISADPEDSKHIRLEDLRRVRDIMEVEQAVISLPQQDEKENQPTTIEIHQGEPIPEEAAEEILMLGIGSDEEGNIQEISDVRVEVETDGVEVPLRKPRRKYRRIKATAETLRHLKEFGADDKIECNECHKLLKPSSFRQHLKTHTGIKPFGCQVCQARFTRKGDVERHIRIVHNKQKPFSCHRCPRSFGDKKNLRWHLMNHDKKLFYVCETCGFKFGKKEYYENHVRFIHPLPEDEHFGEEEECSTTLPETFMEVDGECAETLQLHNYLPSGYVIKKSGASVSVLDSVEGDDFDGEATTLEITEEQLQTLLQQNSYGKRIAFVSPKRIKYSSNTKKTPDTSATTSSATTAIAPRKKPKNTQVVSFKELEKLTNLSSEQIAKLHMSSKDANSDGIEAVVIQIEHSSDTEHDTDLVIQQLHEEDEEVEQHERDEVEQSERDEVEQSVRDVEVEQHEELILPDNTDSPVIITQSYSTEEYVTSAGEGASQANLQDDQPKEVNIVVSKSSSQEGGEADANVQSLIDALLDAAKDSSQNSGTSTT